MVLSIIVPDNIAVRVRDEFCEWHGFDPSGPETKLEFVQRKVREFIKEAVKLNESAKAAALADAAARASVDSEIVLS